MGGDGGALAHGGRVGIPPAVLIIRMSCCLFVKSQKRLVLSTHSSRHEGGRMRTGPDTATFR